MASAGSIFVDLLLRDVNYVQGINRARQNTKSATSGMSRDFSSLSKVITGAFAGLSAGAIFGKFIQNTINAQNEQAQLQAVLKSTGNAAGFTAEQLNKMSQALSSQSTFSSGEITSAQTRLLSYVGILGENVPRAMQAVIDQSARLNISLEQSAETVGRALEQPSKAAAALSRQGFGSYFTKDVIEGLKALEQQGDVAQAQIQILEVLEESYAGAASAARDTLGGAIKNLNNTINDILEDPNGLTGLASLINNFSLFLQQAATDTNLFETAAYGWAASLLEVYRAYNQLQIAYREKTNIFGLNDKLIVQYTENVDKATAALDRLSIELAGRKEAIKPAPISITAPSLPTLQAFDFSSDSKAEKEAEKRAKELASIYERNRRIITGLDNSTLKYNDTLKELNELLSGGAITHDQYNDALTRAQEEYDKLTKKTNVWAIDTEATAKRAAENIQDALADFLFDPFEKGLAGMLDSFVKTLQRMAAEAASKQILIGLFGEGGFSSGGGIIGSIFNSGPSLSQGSMDLAKGGSLFSFDVGTNYVPRDMVANIHKGEMIIPAYDAEKMRNGGMGGNNVTVNVINNSQSNVRTEERDNGNGMELMVMIDEAVARNMGTPGTRTNQALGAFNNRGLIRR